jgi:hypothetical protein
MCCENGARSVADTAKKLSIRIMIKEGRNTKYVCMYVCMYVCTSWSSSRTHRDDNKEGRGCEGCIYLRLPVEVTAATTLLSTVRVFKGC